jgi:hypothetical protein
LVSNSFSGSQKTSQWVHWLVFLCVSAILLLAPIVRGGNRQIALTLLLALGLVVLAVILAQATHRLLPGQTGPGAFGAASAGTTFDAETSSPRPRWWWAMVLLLASSPVWVGVLQLVPIGSGVWASLAGREPYAAALAAAGVAVPGSLPLSLHPSATWAALWSAVPVMAVFVAALFIHQHHTEQLLRMLLLGALLQSLLGLLQFVQGGKGVLYFASSIPGIIGTFNNRNHLADFLAMLVPVWFFFLIGAQKPKRHRRTRSAAGRLVSATKPLWVFSGFGMLVVVLSTRSRGGLIAVASVLLLCISFYLLSVGSKFTRIQKVGVVAASLAFLGAALFVGEVDSVGRRFEGVQLKSSTEIRNAYALATLDAARTFWPWGSGMGSFEAVFPRFQPLQAPGYVPHAHNDYPQLLMELGAAAVLIVGTACALVVLQVRSLWLAVRRARRLSSEVALRIFAGLGVLAMLLHSWVEFNMHIPALAITAAFLAGVFLKPLPKSLAGPGGRTSRSTGSTAPPVTGPGLTQP